MLVVGFFPVLLGLILTAREGTFQLRQAIGIQFKELAKEASTHTVLALQKEVNQLRYLASVEPVRLVLIEPSSMSKGKALLFLGQFFQEESATSVGLQFLQVFDPQGNRTFSSTENPPTSPLIAQTATNAKEVRLGPVYQDSQTSVYLFDLLFPITDPMTQERMGTLMGTYSLTQFLEPYVFDIRFGNTGHAMLIDSQGTVLVCPILPTGSHVTDKPLLASITSDRPGWITAGHDGHGGQNSIVGFAPVSFKDIQSDTRWHSFVRQEPYETDAPIRSLLAKVLLSGVFLVVVMSFLVFVAAERLVKPIRMLKEGTQKIGAGAMKQRLEIHTGDEIESLATSFNEMAQRLSESYGTLEQKVEERTRALTALNQIGTTLIQSLHLQALLQGTLEKVLEVFRLESGLIHLIEEGESQLVLRAKVGIDSDDPLVHDQPAVEAVSRESHLWKENLEQDTPSSLRLAKLGFKTVVAVPIRSPQRILGCLTLASRNTWPYNAQQLELLLSIGNQIGMGVENAMLFQTEKKLVEQLMKMDRMKDAFLSNISHEFRMPLTAIVGYSELLLDHFKGDFTVQQQEYLLDILDNGKHLSELISTLLDISKIRAGKMAVYPVHFTFNDMVLGLERILQPTLIKKQMTFQADVSLSSPFFSDPNKIKQVLSNLLANAIKFTPNGGSVRLRIVETTFREGPAVMIQVSDTGIGIPAESLDHIFDPFNQIDSSYTRDYPGTGLGLAITKSLVELLEGTTKVESTPGQGSVFSIILPAFSYSSVSHYQINKDIHDS